MRNAPYITVWGVFIYKSYCRYNSYIKTNNIAHKASIITDTISIDLLIRISLLLNSMRIILIVLWFHFIDTKICKRLRLSNLKIFEHYILRLIPLQR